MITGVTSALLAFVVSLLLTPAVREAAIRWGLVDAAGRVHRKVHAEDIPRLGGLAIVAGFYVPFLGMLVYETEMGRRFFAQPDLAASLLLGGVIIAALGVYDDLFGSGAKIKFAVQFVVALTLYWVGFRINVIDLPFLPVLELGALGLPVTLLWMVGVTNAVNLIDGLDGLAAGIAVLALAPMLAIAVVKGALLLALVITTLMGATLGFLVFNFHPARIFMGDTGSMFLGFLLSIITIHTSHKTPAVVALLTPVLALGMPIMDTSLAVARRAWRGRPLFSADRGHIHHRLMDAGLGHRGAVLVMYLVAAAFAASAAALALNRGFASGLVLVATGVVAGVFMRWLGFVELGPRLLAELKDARTLRRRNRALHRAIRRAQPRLEAAEHLEEVLRLLGTLIGTSGAQWAQLDVVSGDAEGTRRTLTWGSGPGEPTNSRQHTFRLQTPAAGDLGTLTLSWDAQAVWDDGVTHGLEGFVEELAPHIERMLALVCELPEHRLIPLEAAANDPAPDDALVQQA